MAHLTVYVKWPEWAAYDRDHPGELGRLGGTRYTQAQVEQMLGAAGWRSSVIPKMSAIIMGESGGWSAAVNPDGEYSVGLAQININPSLRRPWTEAQLIVPAFNLKIALQLYNERQAQFPNGLTVRGKRYTGEDVGLTHWGAFTDGRYKTWYKGTQISSSPANSGGKPGAADRPPEITTADKGLGVALALGVGALILFG